MKKYQFGTRAYSVNKNVFFSAVSDKITLDRSNHLLIELDIARNHYPFKYESIKNLPFLSNNINMIVSDSLYSFPTATYSLQYKDLANEDFDFKWLIPYMMGV